jgi:phosphoribosylformylglycinamidine synthase
MSGSFNELDVPPALVSFAVNVSDARYIISPELKSKGNTIAVIKTPYTPDLVPDFDKLVITFTGLNKLIRGGTVVSAHTVPNGGLIAALCKMAFGNGVCFDITVDNPYDAAPMFGSFVVEVAGNSGDIEDALAEHGLEYEIIGKTTGGGSVYINKEEIGLNDLMHAWLSPLESVFPAGPLNYRQENDDTLKPFISSKTLKSRVSYAKPKVLIPVFPGTTADFDMAKKFRGAGAEADTFIFRNINADLLRDSFKELSVRISDSQALVLSGGIYCAAVLDDPYVRESVLDLFGRRDGLVLGTGSGFSALIRSGLLLSGNTRNKKDSISLAQNASGRYISELCGVKIISNMSPWLYGTEIGDTYLVPVSTGEGRFVAGDGILNELIRNGQVAAQYTGRNPCGSALSIEAVTSACGRVLGRLGHTERTGANGEIYKNIPGKTDACIFESGVNYFL